MRSIPATLADKVRLLQQTKGNDADPKLSVVISRHKVPITDYGMWQTSEVGVTNVTRAAIAASRPSPNARVDRLYIAAIENGNAVVYSEVFDGYRPPVVWTPESTIEGAIAVALAFEGQYSSVGRHIEFSTIGAPWVFWIDTDGDVYGKLLTGEGVGEALATDAVAISAIMGPAGIDGSVSSGLILAWATAAGAILTRQYCGGVWESGVLCSAAPANIVDVALSRTWDYRVSLTMKASDGKVYLMMSGSMVSGNANLEQLVVNDIAMTADVNVIINNDVKAADENISTAVDITAEAWSIIPPTLVSVANIDDENGNWGVKLRLVYSGPVYNLTGNAGQFSLSAGGTFAGEALAYDEADPSGSTLILTVSDFNNGSPACTLSYTQGTLINGGSVTLLDNASIEFTATGLVPTSPPAVVSIEAVSNTIIDVLFDAALSLVNIGANSAAFTVSGNEPLYSPGGANVATNYAMSSVAFKPGTNDTVRLTLTDAGRLKYPQGNVTVAYVASSGNLKNAGGTLAVSSFSTAFAPNMANITKMFHPYDPENISVAVELTVAVGLIAYQSAKNGDEQLSVDVGFTIIVHDTSNNEV